MKKSLISAVLALGIIAPACLGPDNAYNGIKNWNATVTEQDWVNELIFLGLWIIPVYPIATFGDILLFNTVTYWSGDDMIGPAGPFPGFSRGE